MDLEGRGLSAKSIRPPISIRGFRILWEFIFNPHSAIPAARPAQERNRVFVSCSQHPFSRGRQCPTFNQLYANLAGSQGGQGEISSCSTQRFLIDLA
jgi:hypothetical protein